jgi:HPt (histidine-containing phosphotransfer) domain-containing protein
MTLAHTETQPVDLAVLATYDEAQMEGEPDFVIELIEIYLSEVPRLFDTIRTSIINNDRATLRRAAHSLRGSSANLGVLQMAAIAGKLEHLENKSSSAAAELLRSLEDEFERVKEILNAERQRRSA